MGLDVDEREMNLWWEMFINTTNAHAKAVDDAIMALADEPTPTQEDKLAVDFAIYDALRNKDL